MSFFVKTKMVIIVLFIILICCGFLITSVKGSKEREDWQIRMAKKIVDKNIIFKPLYGRDIKGGSPSAKFFARHFREMLALKLGQRKLFFSELEFYTIFINNFFTQVFPIHSLFTQSSFNRENTDIKIYVIYAGAASGIHSTLIAELFNYFFDSNGKKIEWDFHYYDTNNFSEDLKNYNNIHLYKQYFTADDASYWSSFSHSSHSFSSSFFFFFL